MQQKHQTEGQRVRFTTAFVRNYQPDAKYAHCHADPDELKARRGTVERVVRFHRRAVIWVLWDGRTSPNPQAASHLRTA